MNGSPADRTIVIEPSRRTLGVDLAEMWEYRYLFLRMLVRPIQVRYKQTLLGISWAVLKPLAATLVFTLFFGKLLDVQRHVGVPYPLFVFAGLLPWNFAAATVTGASSSTVGNAHLITKVYFPRVFLPVSVLGWTALDFSVGAAVLAGLMVWYGVAPGINMLLLPVLLLLLAGGALGVGIFLSKITFRQVQKPGIVN